MRLLKVGEVSLQTQVSVDYNVDLGSYFKLNVRCGKIASVVCTCILYIIYMYCKYLGMVFSNFDIAV